MLPSSTVAVPWRRRPPGVRGDDSRARIVQFLADAIFDAARFDPFELMEVHLLADAAKLVGCATRGRIGDDRAVEGDRRVARVGRPDDGHRPAFADEECCLVGRQIEDIAGSIARQIDSVDALGELTDQPDTHRTS